ncbi:MAG TPA: DinB family protein [Vicinamibacterales bacterium]
MTRTELLHLVDYHYWARDRMLAALDALPPEEYLRPRGGSFASIRDTAVHIYSAEWVWLERWHGVSPTAPLDVNDFPDVAALRAAWTALEARMRAYVAGLEGDRVNERVAYRNMAGVAAESSRWTMLQHVVNHASYHRGQVTTMVRQAGGQSPAAQDLIAYYREKGI